jgi:hypothetical protein
VFKLDLNSWWRVQIALLLVWKGYQIFVLLRSRRLLFNKRREIGSLRGQHAVHDNRKFTPIPHVSVSNLLGLEVIMSQILILIKIWRIRWFVGFPSVNKLTPCKLLWPFTCMCDASILVKDSWAGRKTIVINQSMLYYVHNLFKIENIYLSIFPYNQSSFGVRFIKHIKVHRMHLIVQLHSFWITLSRLILNIWFPNHLMGSIL